MEKIYQIILDNILSLIKSDWQRIVFYAQYEKDSYEMKFYIKTGDIYTDCFSLGISDDVIVDMFTKLDADINQARKNIAKKSDSVWNVMTMSVESNGNFKADFDYLPISDNIISYKSNWKAKYLV